MNDRFFSLQLFARVARGGSFSVAGREMGVSQPTASRIVAALEKQIGVALFVRTTRAVTLTEAGSDYLSRIEPILTALEEADHAARGTGELRGLLRVAAPSGFAIRGVLPRLARFTEQHPGLRIEFILNDDRQDLVGESVDVALRIGVLGDSTAVARKIGNGASHRCRGACVSGQGRDSIGPRRPYGPCDHRGPRWASHGGMDVSRRDGKASSVRVEGRFILNGMAAAAAAAIAGLGILSTGDLSVMSELETGRLVRVLPIGRWDRRTSTSFFRRAELRSRLPAHSRTSWRPSFGKCWPPGVQGNASPVKCS